MPPKNPAFSNSQRLSLHEAMNWIAFDDFEGVSEPALEGDFVEFIPFEDESISKSRSDAIRDLTRILSNGGIEAVGYLSVEPLDGRPPISGFHDWPSRIYMNHSPEQSSIPPPLWTVGSINWARSSVKGFDREYAGVVLDREKVLALWPERSAATDRQSKKSSNAGRPPQYSELQFLRLCVWEASRSGLPDHPAEFIRRMDLLIPSFWGENGTPAETWMKEKVGAIYDLREKFKEGRK